MSGKLQEEIQQSQPFPSLEAEVELNILHTADLLTRAVDQLLKPHGLTSTQYNVLRILRGAGEAGATCRAIAERMIHQDPDITRLLDRMVKREWVKRERDLQDRRAVSATITAAGLEILATLQRPLEALLEAQFQGLSPAQLTECIGLMEAIRRR